MTGVPRVIRAYADLLRVHFFFAWPLLFCSGFLLATVSYGGFSWPGLLVAAIIGFCGFEAGLVLNDYVDRTYDQGERDSTRLTKYWRPFHQRPIPAGLVTPGQALALFSVLAGIAAILVLTLPFPHSAYVLVIMAYSYSAEVFYQVKKRDQGAPIAQLVGRTDFSLFPVAGYLVVGHPDITAALYFLFFYPFTLAHLGVNDLIDEDNDRDRGMITIPVLYGARGTRVWIAGFTILHLAMAAIFALSLGGIARAGCMIGATLLVTANYIIMRGKTPDAGLKALPLVHITMLVYAIAISIDAVV